SLVLAKPLLASKKKENKKIAARKKEIEWAEVDDDLFEKLREKRTEIAQRKGVRAYIIFGDKTLIDMAMKKPLTQESFSDIYGVGEKKLKSYANTFIEVIKNYR
ncbi:HRDC domain-containing protein, partial [Candidatus Omnitrophota bacterium]